MIKNITEIKAKSDIINIIGSFLILKKSGVKWCSRDVYDWTYTNRAFPRGGSGDTKSFALNLGAGEVLKIVFVGGANIINTLFNGSVSLSFIPQIAPVIPEPPEVKAPQEPQTQE
ncbi:hypothetical protein [Helicobacter cinaedi]|uniref:hypothetical protein n=1 Tax=Helicobacter cinaedi TaxID=213 RepID=UPI000DA1CBB4|nr:hypothetical protein [Helicobacter cinaedi]